MLDSDKVDVRLRKGENKLLVKICQGTGGWGFCVRVADEWGTPVTDGIAYGFGWSGER